MTATILADCIRPAVGEAPVGPAQPPTGATPHRDYFNGCDTMPALPRYEHPAGPPSPFPNRWTLAMAVEQIARTAA